MHAIGGMRLNGAGWTATPSWLSVATSSAVAFMMASGRIVLSPDLAAQLGKGVRYHLASCSARWRSTQSSSASLGQEKTPIEWQ